MSTQKPDADPGVRALASEMSIMALIDALNRNGQSEVAHAALKAASSYAAQAAEHGADPDRRVADHVKWLFRGLNPETPRHG